MKIAASSVQMASAGRYYTYSADGAGTAVAKKTSSSAFNETWSGYAGDTGKSFNDSLFANYTKNGALAENTARTNGIDSGLTAANGISLRDLLLARLFMRFNQIGMFSGGLSLGSPYLSIDAGGASYTKVNYEESEELSFRASGQAMTEDGRTLAFDMNIFLSRSFVETTQVQVPVLASALMDPLVVNVGSSVAHVSDQTFRFDLDADGTEEDVASLGAGSGFLALDKNGDGVINDGSELFGAKSGDGFGDLRAYDSDGNGWIDENDEVFSKLKVWYKNGDGTDELVDLKEAGIGAIYLGEQETEFSLKGEGNRLNGMMRSTGIFLREDGGAGTIQHVDLAVRDPESGEDSGNLTDSAVGGENFVSGYGREDRQVVPDVLVITNPTDGASSADGGSKTDDETKRSSSKTERELARENAAKRRAERKRRNDEFAQKARQRREDEEARIEKLFEDRADRLRTAQEKFDEAKDRRESFNEAWNDRHERERSLSA